MTASELTAVENLLWPRQGGRDVWMVLDGARDRRIYGTLLDSYLEHVCLYQGQLDPELELAAPYLVQLEYEDRYTRRLLELAWGNSWGIILHCSSSMASLRRHLRTFLKVRDERGRQLVFRYYDPRVLRVYLPTCTGAEARTVFGPIGRFYVEDEDPRQVWEFRRENGHLRSRLISLSPPAQSA